MQLNEKEVIAYTRWIRSSITKLWLGRAENALKNDAKVIDDNTTEGAVKAHYIRKGGELVLEFLQGQLTYEEYQKHVAAEPQMEYDAEDIVNEDLFNQMEE